MTPSVMIRCALDHDDCIDLLSVLQIVGQINMEQAWAIAYEIARLIQRLSPANCAPIQSLNQIYLHKEGFVHQKSLIASLPTNASASGIAKLNTKSSSIGEPQTPDPKHNKGRKSKSSISLNESISDTNHNDIRNRSCHTTSANLSHSNQYNSSATRTQIPASVSIITLSPTFERETSTPTATSESPATSSEGATQLTSELQLAHSSAKPPNATPSDDSLVTGPPTPPITPELSNSLNRRPATSETQLIASLGVSLFWALDFGIAGDQERKLGSTMECFIVQSQNKLTLDELFEVCTSRLPLADKSKADAHYRGICKNLISDTIELSIFLDKIYTASMVLSDITLNDCLEDHTLNGYSNSDGDDDDDDLSRLGEPLASLRALRINDWARLWMQVIRELRQRGSFQQAQVSQLIEY